MTILNEFVNSIMFWAAWIIIPLIMEIVPAIGSAFVLLKKFIKKKHYEDPQIWPEITLIIPVYNSQDSLEACIRSIEESTYPNDKIRIFLVNNQGKDNSFQIYTKCQEKYPGLLMQWLNAKQGKSRALNLALFNSDGKYIVHVDSDGVFEPHALCNLVRKFEAEPDIGCMTGAILIVPEMIEEYHGFGKIFREMEFMEYAQAFLAGRNYADDRNNIYTLSGAFSAFRKSAVLKSQMYNTDTICEDTHITFQMRFLQEVRICICENALFMVDPIEDVNKLYTQRQRWQRGSLEVSHQFLKDKLTVKNAFTDVTVRTLMYDHTFAFPRVIWYLALICLMAMHFSSKMIALSTGMIMVFYIFVGYLYYISTVGFLREFPKLKKYYAQKWYIVPFLPLFNLVVFFIRLAGIVNSIGTDGAWKTKNLTQERESFTKEVFIELRKPKDMLEWLRSKVNEPEVEEI